LSDYLKRIQVAAEQQVDLATLRGLQRTLLLNIPYENLDVQLGRPVGRDPMEAFNKLVTRNRSSPSSASIGECAV
jgi:N-hydroxyarylamine O-acetyltransferase